MKKLISNIMVLTIIIAGFLLSETIVKADGWMDYVQDGELDTWISGIITKEDDYYFTPAENADFYKIQIPANGILTVKTNKLDIHPAIHIYNENADEIYYRVYTDDQYDSENDICLDYYLVSEGTYYVGIYDIPTVYQIYFGYEASVTETRISNVKAGKKVLTVSWDKANDISGYQLQYATAKSMKNAKTITLKKNKKSKKITGLKGKKKYTVRIRAFKTINGKTYYSNWSNKMTGKTK